MSDLCSLCQTVEAGPYCPVSGEVRRPFAIAERYEVDELLGSLGEAIVFGACDAITGRAIAIAVQRAPLTDDQIARVREAQERTVRESAALDVLGPERAGIIESGWDDALDASYLVVGYIDDPTLWPRLEEVDAILGALEAPTSPETTVPSRRRRASTQLPATIGSYDVIAALGSGSTGRVYLGQHPVIGSRVAIKVLLPQIARSPETVERFIQEARASSQIGSPHIPRYFDFGTTADGLPYAIMEYFEGETLGVRLRRVGTLSVAETAQIIEQVASALLMAHEAGLVHRDLKPDNILLVNPDAKGNKSAPLRATGSSVGAARPPIEIKVLDFGIAKVVGNRSPNRTLTGSFLGTPYYCAPEQVFGHEVDARTDVYCLGATAFEMLTGAPPFVGPVPVILSSKATEDPPDLADRGVPGRVASTIRRMLAREPQHRAPSMAWVLEEVAGWLTPTADVADHRGAAIEPAPQSRSTVVEQSPRTGHPVAPAAGPPDELVPSSPSQASRAKAPRRRRVWLALAFTGSALAAGTAVMLLRSSPRSTPSPAPSQPEPSNPEPSTAAAKAADSPTIPSSTVPPPTDSPTPSTTSSSTDSPATPSKTSSTSASATTDSPTPSSASASPATIPSRAGADPAAGSQTGARVERRRPAKPADRKSPKKAPVTRPPSETKDILIVDPYSSPRSDSP